MTRDEAIQLIADIRSVFPPYGQVWSPAADDPEEEPVHRQYRGTHKNIQTTGHRFKDPLLVELPELEITGSYRQQARGWEREAARRADRRRLQGKFR